MYKLLSYTGLISLIILMFSTVTPALASSDAACEAARDKLLAPLRQQKIKECQSDPKNEPDWCASFYSDYGNATRRPDGRMNKRMYDDIPECKE